MLNDNVIHIQYLSQDQVARTLAELEQQDTNPLLLLEHSSQLPSREKTSSTLIQLQSGLNSINNINTPCYELWTAKGFWEHGIWETDTDISFCMNDDYLIGSLSVQLPFGHSLKELTQTHYEQIINFIDTQNKPYLLRMWNYFPDINQYDNKLERYQQFCVGRHLAFAQSSLSTANEIQYPAASAVGSHASTMVIIFIATAKMGLFLENPDQTSAYHYPSHYSPQSPSFARASVYQGSDFSQLYISGTASIVGHKSQFHGDIAGQTRQTIKNLNKLIQHTNSQKEVPRPFNPSDTGTASPALKVYLRNPADLSLVSPLIQDFSPNSDNICYLQADICRQELDIEIEMLLNA